MNSVQLKNLMQLTTGFKMCFRQTLLLFREREREGELLPVLLFAAYRWHYTSILNKIRC